MPEKKIRVPFPNAAAPLVDGMEVLVKESTDRWSDVLLEDGSILRIKPNVLSAIRIQGQFDPDGNPMYLLKASQTMMVASAPDHLHRDFQNRKVQ